MNVVITLSKTIYLNEEELIEALRRAEVIPSSVGIDAGIYILSSYQATSEHVAPTATGRNKLVIHIEETAS